MGMVMGTDMDTGMDTGIKAGMAIIPMMQRQKRKNLLSVNYSAGHKTLTVSVFSGSETHYEYLKHKKRTPIGCPFFVTEGSYWNAFSNSPSPLSLSLLK